jgi:putative transposase
VPISTRRTCREPSASQGAKSSYKNLRVEPPDHAIGRSRGGLSIKIHHLVDGRCRPMVILLGPGQSRDSPMFAPLLEQLSAARIGPGRPRTRPDRVLGNRADSSRANRAILRSRGIQAVISEPSDQKGHRRRRGRAGGRPSSYAPSPSGSRLKRHALICSAWLSRGQGEAASAMASWTPPLFGRSVMQGGGRVVFDASSI